MTPWAWLTTCALAGGFTHRETRDPLPAREVARDLVLPKGWSSVTLGAERTRWDGDAAPRPFPGASVRRAADLAVRVSLGDRAELRARVPYVDVRTGGALGAGLGGPTVGAAWSLARGVAPSRSMAWTFTWTPPDGHPRLPLGAAVHQLSPRLAGRFKNGGLRLTASMGAWLTPPGTVPWLRDATGARQRLDLADGVVGEGEALLQAGPLGGTASLEAAWLGPDRVDGVVVAAAGTAATVRWGGFVQWNRSVRTGLVLHATPWSRSRWLAPLPRPSDAGAGARLWWELAL